MDKTSIVMVIAAVTTTTILSMVYLISGIIPSIEIPQHLQSAYAQTVSQGSSSSNATVASNATTTPTTSSSLISAIHPGTDASPISAVVFINQDTQGNVLYVPSNVTMRVGDELLVVNNGTDSQSLTNGMGPDDPNAGKFFDTGPIAQKGFAEYVSSNLSPGTYPFYSTNSTSTTGVLTIQPSG